MGSLYRVDYWAKYLIHIHVFCRSLPIHIIYIRITSVTQHKISLS